jgi:CRISPR/Cas system CMR-associated protein Cmr5 small subunit
MKLLSLALAFITLFSVTIDDTKIRYGAKSRFDETKNHVIGVVDSKQVYRHTRAYKKIIGEKVEKGSARYSQLMLKATRQYKEVLEVVARDKNCVLIVEIGGVSGYPTIEVTKICVEHL